MKKLSLLIILSIFLTSILAGAVFAVDPFTGDSLITNALKTFGKVTEDILGGVFKSIIEKPDIWMRFLTFVGIFAVLFMVFQAKGAKKLIDRKTAGILGFVLSFGTAAIMPVAWLIVALSIWGGIIMAALIAAPSIILLSLTIGVLRDKETHIAWRIIALIIAWGFYIWIVASVAGSLIHSTSTISAAAPGFGMAQMIDNAVYRAQTFQFVVEMVVLVGIISIIVLALSLLLGTGGGRQMITKGAGWAGQRFYKLPLVRGITGGIPGVGSSRLAVFIDTCNDVITNLAVAKGTADDSTKKDCQNAINNAVGIISTLSTKGAPQVQAIIMQLKKAGVTGKEMQKLITDMPALTSSSYTAIREASHALKEIKKKTPDWNIVKQSIDNCRRSIEVFEVITNNTIALQQKQAKKP